MTRERGRAQAGGGRRPGAGAKRGGGREARGREQQSAGAGKTLRSDAWLTGDDEAAMQHRVALRTSGLSVGRGGRRAGAGAKRGGGTSRARGREERCAPTCG